VTQGPVILFDVDNTLLDNDRVQADLRDDLSRTVGPEASAAYFEILEDLRGELGYVDYLGALQRYRVTHPPDPRLLEVSHFLIDYPFAERLYPGALDVVRRLSGVGTVAILSDGDVVFQPRKVRRSGLWDAFAGKVLIYIHKEQELADVEARLPASRYVLIDDKLRILTAVKEQWGDRVTTVFPQQGHYASDPSIAELPAADVTVARIGDLLDHDPASLVGA
jgi:phosphoglycolate phosphatase-like HAD superfamily hydrolase